MFVWQHIKEDAHTLYGFAGESEKRLFMHLVSVSGIGPNTARMMLSSITPEEIQTAIVKGNVTQIQRIKGIGPKSAQRVILELQDKLKKEGPDTLTVVPQDPLPLTPLGAAMLYSVFGGISPLFAQVRPGTGRRDTLNNGTPIQTQQSNNLRLRQGILTPDPPNLVRTIQYDPATNRYILLEKIGNLLYRPPVYLTYAQCLRMIEHQKHRAYFKKMAYT